MVPKRLSRNPKIADPLAAFGCLSGMVFPVLMFPACILYGLAELLIPELARCHAAGSRSRIHYLTRRCLRIALLYGVLFGGLEFLLARPLCLRLYQSREAGTLLQLYALLVPMLYCDAITDAMTKGLGQQKVCVLYNILTNAMDVALLFFLLPRYGMMGYFFSFAVTHLLNFLLSLHRLLKITAVDIPFSIPAMTIAASLAALWACTFLQLPLLRCLSYPAILISLLYLLRIISREDFLWLKGLICKAPLQK